MPSMIEGRSDHSLVRLKSKLFAIGGGASSNTNCEVFDKTSNMFVTLETPEFRSYKMAAVSTANKIFVLHSFTKVVLCYCFDKDEWTEKSCEAIENIAHYSSVTVPLY